MVLEDIINPIKAERRPWDMFFLGIVYSSVAVLLSMIVFSSESSMVVVFLTVLASVHVMHGAIKLEEQRDLSFPAKKVFFKTHARALSFFMFLFMGFVVSYAFWNIFLPSEAASQLFETQIESIQHIERSTSSITGKFIAGTPFVTHIFMNNLRVLFFVLLFAFFYGVGAIFILAWNASVIGVAIGNFVRSNIHLSYFESIPLGILRYSIHGIPEILAYFMAGLAGGIISVAVARHEYGSPGFRKVLFDSVDLAVGAVVVLFIAALMEVYITPAFF